MAVGQRLLACFLANSRDVSSYVSVSGVGQLRQLLRGGAARYRTQLLLQNVCTLGSTRNSHLEQQKVSFKLKSTCGRTLKGTLRNHKRIQVALQSYFQWRDHFYHYPRHSKYNVNYFYQTDSQQANMRVLTVFFTTHFHYSAWHYEPPAPCQSVLVGAGRGREHGAGSWPPAPTADLSDPPGQTGKKGIGLEPGNHVVLCRRAALKYTTNTQYVK